MKRKSPRPTFVSFPRQRSVRILLLSLVLDNVFLQHEAAAAATAPRYFADVDSDFPDHSDFSPSLQHVPEDDQATGHAVESAALPGNAGAREQLSSPLNKYLQSFAGAKSRFMRPGESPATARHATQTSERDLGQRFNSDRDSEELSTVHGRNNVPRHRPVLSSGKYYTTHGRLRERDPTRAFHEEGNPANEPTHLHDDTRNSVSEHAKKLGKMQQGEQYFGGGQTVERGAVNPSGNWQGSKNDLTQPLTGFSTDTDSQEFGSGYGSRGGLSPEFSSGHESEGNRLPEFGSGYARGHDNMLTSGDENSEYGSAQQERGEQTGASRHLQPSSDQRDYQSHEGDHEHVDDQPKLSAQNRDWADASSRSREDNSADTPREGAEASTEENTAIDGKNAEATDTKSETAVKSIRNKLTRQGQEYSLDGQPKLSAQNQDWADASSRSREDNSADTPGEGAEAFAEEKTAIDGKNAEAIGTKSEDEMKSIRSKSTGQETNVRSLENEKEEPRDQVNRLASVQNNEGTDKEGLMKIIRILIKSEEAMKSLSNMLGTKQQENLGCSMTTEECVDKNQPSAGLTASSVSEDSPRDRQQNLRIQEEKAPDTERSSVEDASNPIIVNPTVPDLADQRDVIGNDPVSQDTNEKKFDDPSMPTASVVEVDEEHLQKDFAAVGQQDSEAHTDDEENPALGSDSSETLQTDNAHKSHSSASVSTNVEGDNKQEDIANQVKGMVTNVLKGLAVSPTANHGPEDEVAPFFQPSNTKRMTSLTGSDVPSAVTDAAVAGMSSSTRSYLVSPAGENNHQYVSFASNANGIYDDDWMSAEPSPHAERDEAGKRSVYYGQLTRFRRSSDARQQQETADVAHRWNQIADDDDGFYYYDNDGAELSAADMTNSINKFLEDRVAGPAKQLVTSRTAVFRLHHTSQDPEESSTSLQGDSSSIQIGKEDFLAQAEMRPAIKNGRGVSNNLQSNSKPTNISNAALNTE